jgi:hypothetical protein
LPGRGLPFIPSGGFRPGTADQSTLPPRTVSGLPGGRPPPPSSRGLDACAAEFARYQSNGNLWAFTIKTSSTEVVCSAGAITDVAREEPAAMQVRPEVGGLFETYPIRIDGGELFAFYEDTIWFGKGSTPPAPGVAALTVNELRFFINGPQPAVRGVYVQVVQGDAEPSAGQTCLGWARVPGTLGITHARLSLRAVTPEDRSASASGALPFNPELIERPFIASPDDDRMVIGDISRSLGAAQAGWVRLIPSQDATPGPANRRRCTVQPTQWLKVVRDDEPEPPPIKIEGQDRRAAEARGKEIYEARQRMKLMTTGPRVTGRVIGYVPSSSGSNGARITQSPMVIKPQFLNPAGVPLNPDTSNPAIWDTWQEWNLSPDIPWRNELRDWYTGCLYNPETLAWAVRMGESILTWDLWDYVTTAWNAITNVYAMMPQFVANILVHLHSIGQCPIQDPFGTGSSSNDPAGCAEARSVFATAGRTAMSYLGLPPNLPSSTTLLKDGAEWLARTVVNTAITQITSVDGFPNVDLPSHMTDAARDFAINQTRDRIMKIANIQECAYPVAGMQDARSRGLIYNPITGCGYQPGPLGATSDFWAMGKAAAQPTSGPRQPVVWVEVEARSRARKGDIVEVAARMELPDSAPQLPGLPALLQDRLSAIWDDDVRRNGIYSTAFVRTTLTRDGADRFKVALRFHRKTDIIWSLERMVWQSGICPRNAFEAGCHASWAERIWRQLHEETNHVLHVNLSAPWTNDVSDMQACAVVDGVTGCHVGDGRNRHEIHTGLLDTDRVNPTIGLFGVNQLSQSGIPVCPGMTIKTDAKTGLEFLSTDIREQQLQVAR